ncbi:MAG TPA: tetratricopeptide repeat protein [Myxococcota bacterium]|nr:tetratricopeptide repeat protein [Myxococcota bacterium]
MGRTHPLPRAILLVLVAALGAGPARALPAASSAPAAQEGADEQYQYVAGLCEQGLFDVAVREARDFLRRWPRHAKASLARYRLASSLFELERFDEALREYAQLDGLAAFEFAAEVRFRLGQCLLETGEPARAAQVFAGVAELGKDYLLLPATFFLGEAQLQAERFADAEASYAAVLERDGGGEYARDARYGLVWCAFRLGDHDRTVERVAAFLRAYPQDEAADELHYLAGEAHLAAGRPREALAAYREVRGEAHAAAAARGAAFALAAAGDHAKAARGFEQLAERSPDDPFADEARLHAGIEWLHGGDPERAARQLRSDALSGDPEALAWRAQAELELGRADAALAALDTALEARPEGELRERLFALRGDALSDLGRADEAVHAYGRSGSEYARYAAAVAALNDGRHEQACRLARALLESRPDGEYATELQLVLGEGLLALDHPAEAAPAFQAVLDADPPPPAASRARLRLAWCRFLGGDPGAAAALFRASLDEQGDGPEAEEASYMWGRGLEESGDAAGALRVWRAHVKRFDAGPHRAEVLAGLARLDGEHGERWVDELLRAGGDPQPAARALLALADREAEAGDQERAVERYAAFLQRFPEDPGASRARYGQAWGLYDLGRTAEAGAALADVAGDPAADEETRRSALELAVWAWQRAGDVDRSLASYRAFARTAPPDERLWAAAQVVAGALQQADRTADADRVLDEVLDRVRSADTALGALVEKVWVALDAGRLDDAEVALRGAARLRVRAGLEESRVAEACFFVGEGRYDAGDPTRAAELYARAAEWGDPQIVPRALYKLGFCELARERWDEAAQAFRSLTAGYPEHELFGEALFLLGESEYRADRLEQAVEDLSRLRREFPDHEVLPKALFRLGQALGRLERWEPCAAVLAELNRRAPDFANGAEAELWRGRALAALGDPRGARAAFERVIARDEGVLSARARLGIGRAEFAAGNWEEALSQSLRVVVLYAQPEEVAQALLLSGRSLARMGDRDRARAQFTRILDEFGESTSAPAAREGLAALDD